VFFTIVFFFPSPVADWAFCIDYSCEDGRFPVSASLVVVPNHDLLLTNETALDPMILQQEAKRKHLPEWARFQKTISGIYFT
jgi:hypothetical protein